MALIYRKSLLLGSLAAGTDVAEHRDILKEDKAVFSIAFTDIESI